MEKDKRICYNIASRSRPDNFKLRLNEVKDLSESNNYFFCIKIDQDDVAAMRYWLYAMEAYKIIDFTLHVGLSKNKIDAINRDLYIRDADIIVNLSDDQSFNVKGFDTIIRQHCGPDDFLLFPDAFADNQAAQGKNERIATMSIMGVEYYKRFNYIYHPDYTSLWCDNEATQVARILGRLKEVDIPIFEHQHPATGKYPTDKQYKHTEKFYHQDKAIYLKRKAKNFDLIDTHTS